MDISHISGLIEQGELEQASKALSDYMEAEGFNDTVAVLAATINACYGDLDNYLKTVESGLSYNMANYELHLMKGNFYIETDVSIALNEFETALAYCRFEKGQDSEDYKYIKGVYNGFRLDKTGEIDAYIHSLPILIYKSESVCYGILNHFADCMADGLRALGEDVEIIDVLDNPPDKLLPELSGKRFKAILGVQTYMFSVQYNDGRCAHDFIFGPKYNMLFDHPCCMYNHFTKSPVDFTVLTHDRNYVEYIKRYYPDVEGVCLLPPAGEVYKGVAEKKYDLTFVGTYHDPRRWANEIKHFDEIYSGRATALVNRMMDNPNEPYEEALKSVFGEGSGAGMFFDLKCTYFYVMSLYRERILKAILDAGIELHVFGDSFNGDKWLGYKNIIRHPELTPAESLKVYAESRMSLNIMSWHKDGRTERVANMMLNDCLVVTDICDYLAEEYTDGEDILLFDLAGFEKLPERIREILGDENRRKAMTDRARIKALDTDVWSLRAGQFLQIVEQDI